MYIRRCLKCLCVLLIGYNPKFNPFVLRCHNENCNFLMKFTLDNLEEHIPDYPAKTFSEDLLPESIKKEMSFGEESLIDFNHFEKDYAVYGETVNSSQKKMRVKYLIKEKRWQFAYNKGFNKWADSISYWIHDRYVEKAGLYLLLEYLKEVIEQNEPKELVFKKGKIKVVN